MELERVDFNAVKEEINNFLQNDKTEILGISVGQEESLRNSIKILLQAWDNSIPKKKIEDKKKECEEKYNNMVNDVYKKPTQALIGFQRIVGAKEVLQELLENK